MDPRYLVVLAAAGLAGCATHAPQLRPIEPSAEVAIVADARIHAIEVYNDAMGQSAGQGAAGGAVVGAAYGLVCGPVAILCVPLTALIGSGVGALGGSAVGAALAPGEAKREALLERLRACSRAIGAEQRLADGITAVAKSRWTLTQPPAATEIIARLDEVALYSRQGGRMALGVRATVTVKAPAAAAHGDLASKTFSYMGPETDAYLWSVEDDSFRAEALGHALRQIAFEAVAEMSRAPR
jgi:hypothetical protein